MLAKIKASLSKLTKKKAVKTSKPKKTVKKKETKPKEPESTRITDFSQLKFDSNDDSAKMDTKIRAALGLGFSECAEALSVALSTKAHEVAQDMINCAPYGKYDQLLEDKEKIAEFFKTEAYKPENWKAQFVEIKKDKPMMEIVFFNQAVDQGDILQGFVFVGVSGKIRHAFAQVH